MPDGTTLSVATAVAVGICVARAFWRSKRPVEQQHLRGRFLREPPKEDFLGPGGSLRLGRHLFPSGIATRHFAFIGTTGSGKTLLQRLLLQSALGGLGRGHGHRALVYDAKQDLLGLLRGMNVSVPIRTLNPLDARSVSWDMAADIQSPAAALQVASILVPAATHDANPFFTNAARHLLYGTVLSLIELCPRQWTLRHVLLLLREPRRLQALLARTGSTRHLLHYFAHAATAQNIFSTVLTYTSPFEIIAACWDRAGESLSLSAWLNTESVLVLGNDEQNRSALDTLNKLLAPFLNQ